MTFEDYQAKARTTAIYPNIGSNYVYPTLGLTNEAGEVAGKIKKAMRDDVGVITVEKQEDLIAELGDVLWYLAQLATELGITLEDVAAKNLEKLLSRQERGKLQGSGDKR